MKNFLLLIKLGKSLGFNKVSKLVSVNENDKKVKKTAFDFFIQNQYRNIAIYK